ncbi:MAG: hypothetical protein WBL40_10280 [Terrimicrobiaceae bacterium]
MESGRFRGVKFEAIHEGELRVICRACLNLLHHPSRSTKLRVVLWGVSPLVWRRLLLASDTSIAELHEILKSAFDWSGEHLHRFLIHGSTRAWFPAQPEHGILRVRAAQGFQPPRGKENRWYGVAAMHPLSMRARARARGFQVFM